MDNRITEDFEFEDPTAKFVGKSEFRDFLYLCKFLKDVEFKTFGEHHSTHEMILEMSLKVLLNCALLYLKPGVVSIVLFCSYFVSFWYNGV